ncbi:ABC transporter ATP-binding protein [Pseudobacter ginsenosidimutans]|jgi:ABC-2 type transport system ATP-binding protein|uniref:ABC-2 type transport system ATP-binding protein n=1 Tax=Pseudobacter ginsenosidimutans TaxID=661488 RepID=A0A4Q7N2K1_9BACT|nr:ABC transporter ATP-binding protein [Pseudobacter ginsenosidimutans]QEC43663.1 ABC transporter ATP-binding protein [Pseudobacter ginsenosidimutans]RZS75064.1 ABC-2 type transport system ATP-binding protein [Pseudobacter ginsenosidimutans]
MNEAIVKVENLSHRYNSQWAVKDINFELDRNGIYGLLGANGAGKSTIMNIMCGVLNQTQGEVSIKGVNMRTHPVEAKKYIGFLPQKPPLLMDLTVEEYLEHAAGIRLMPESKIREAIGEAMEKVGISHFNKRLIRNLSGGYQQRVGIAQAIIHKPDFVVMDEPTNGLDPNQILEVRNLIREIASERTVVLSTHILQEVQALCDNIWMINQGTVAFAGSMEEFDGYILPSTLVLSMISAPPLDEFLSIPGVMNIEPLGGIRYRVQYTQAQETMERIIETSVQKKWRLLEISLEKMSLENVFAALSQNKTAR